MPWKGVGEGDGNGKIWDGIVQVYLAHCGLDNLPPPHPAAHQQNGGEHQNHNTRRGHNQRQNFIHHNGPPFDTVTSC